MLVMNEKYDVVARHHLVYDSTSAERYRNWIVVTIEKNRSGLDRIDLEFRKRFDQGRLELEGRPVAEQLVDERVYSSRPAITVDRGSPRGLGRVRGRPWPRR